jgi:hypothetical protein
MVMPSANAMLWIITTGIGVVMVKSGLRRGALVRRREQRCPACGRSRSPNGSCGCADD